MAGPEAGNRGICQAAVFQFDAAAPIQWEGLQKLRLGAAIVEVSDKNYSP